MTYSVFMSAEPKGRGFIYNEPDFGLPSGSEVGNALIISVLTIPIGYLILKLGDNSKSNNSSFGGCLGMILIGVGLICLLPLIAWICAIGQVIVGVGIIIAIVIFLFISIFGKK